MYRGGEGEVGNTDAEIILNCVEPCTLMFPQLTYLHTES